MMDITQLAEKHGWTKSSKNDFPDIKKFADVILIFLPNWSEVDLLLIDDIASILNEVAFPVFIFDIDDFRMQDEIKNMFSDFPMITQTPIIALYKNGTLERIEQAPKGIGNFKEYSEKLKNITK